MQCDLASEQDYSRKVTDFVTSFFSNFAYSVPNHKRKFVTDEMKAGLDKLQREKQNNKVIRYRFCQIKQKISSAQKSGVERML